LCRDLHQRSIKTKEAFPDIRDCLLRVGFLPTWHPQLRTPDRFSPFVSAIFNRVGSLFSLVPCFQSQPYLEIDYQQIRIIEVGRDGLPHQLTHRQTHVTVFASRWLELASRTVIPRSGTSRLSGFHIWQDSESGTRSAQPPVFRSKAPRVFVGSAAWRDFRAN
jgi:hypothetical protein